MEPQNPSRTEAELTEDRAREYEGIHNRIFVVRIFMTILALVVYQLSGASAQLAGGLDARFDHPWAWPLANGLYILVTVFGFAAFMFPLSLYVDYILEHRYGLSKQSMEGWLLDFFKSLLFELLLTLVFFEVIYGFLRWSPDYWWVWASICYVLFVVVLSSLAPVLIMPLFHKIEPLDNLELTEAVQTFVQNAGLKVLGVFRWGLEEKTFTANAALAGLGRTRRIILGDTMLKDYSKEEIIAVLAHEVGHYKNKDMPRLIAVGALLAVAGFFIAHLVLRELVVRFGFFSPGDIGAFPVFIFCLFIFSLISMPLSNTYSRRREFAADEFAVRTLNAAAPLVSALEKLAAQNLADKNPEPWIEALLHSHPSISRRVRRAREIEAEIQSHLRGVG
ncbi:MAG: M48 family metallopeptidase [Lentisphaerota bacterium]